MSKILIAYYSRRGQNYVDGVIRDLKIGNTEFLARRLAEKTGGSYYLLTHLFLRKKRTNLYP